MNRAYKAIINNPNLTLERKSIKMKLNYIGKKYNQEKQEVTNPKGKNQYTEDKDPEVIRQNDGQPNVNESNEETKEKETAKKIANLKKKCPQDDDINRTSEKIANEYKVVKMTI